MGNRFRVLVPLRSGTVAKKQMKFFKKTIPTWLILLPYTAFGDTSDWLHFRRTSSTRYYSAYGGYGDGGLGNLFSIVMGILSQVVILLIALAVVFFLYGILKYIASGDDEESRKKSKNVMIYGIIGLFVMISFWGIVNILINTFELDTTPYVDVPYFDSSGSGSGSGSRINWGETNNEGGGNWEEGKIDEPFPDLDPKPY